MLYLSNKPNYIGLLKILELDELIKEEKNYLSKVNKIT
jgi:hypothetical protein